MSFLISNSQSLLHTSNKTPHQIGYLTLSTAAMAAAVYPAAPAMSTSVPSSPSQISPHSSQPGPFGKTALYVGDLDLAITEAQLADLFGQIGVVVSVRVYRDQIHGGSLGYGYVNYHTAEEANKALDTLNFTPLNGKPIRIMYSNRDPSICRSGYANLFVKNLESSIDNKLLLETFSTFGAILSCKVVTDSSGQSKGYGYVQFEHEEALQKAIEKIDGMLMNRKQVHVGNFVRRQDRDRANGSLKFTNVFAKNLCDSVTDDDLKEKFSCCGVITNAVVMKDEHGNSKCFGFVNFEKPDDAAAAVKKFNGETFKDKVLYVGRAQKKTEREAELKAKYEQEKNGRIEKLKAANLYVKNLDDTINDERLKEMFARFGKILSTKVMLDPQGHSSGYGFVQFSSKEEANRAINEMKGQLFGKKVLYVAVAQRKAERTARLQACFGHPWVMAPAIPSLPGYHPSSAGLAPQQLYVSHQGVPGFVPPHSAGYGFQQQFISGVRAGVAPSYTMPYNLQRLGQPGQRMVARRGMQPQLIHQNGNQSFRYMQNTRSPPIAALESALASATPEQQKMILGEQLLPLVQQIEPGRAPKITGMLIEMPPNNVLHLIESHEALQAHVKEALAVLQRSEAAVPDAAT